MTLTRSLAAVSAGALLAAAASVPAFAAPAKPKPLPCAASMSVTRPADFTTTVLHLKTLPAVKVVAVAHFKTVNHKKFATTGPKGGTSIPWKISGATPGFKAKVTITLTKGKRSGSCSTSFTPKRG